MWKADDALTPPALHDAVDGYTPVPATATLSDVKMCTGYTSFSGSWSTRSQCRASCDSSASCMGFSWGSPLPPEEVQPVPPGSPPPLPSPPPIYLDRRRTLLAHDDEFGNCYLITTAITTSSVVSGYDQAGCYKKGTLPVA